MNESGHPGQTRIGGAAWQGRRGPAASDPDRGMAAPERPHGSASQGEEQPGMAVPRMGFAQAVRAVLQKYATFSGRARRAEYWWWAVFLLLSGVAVAALEGALGMQPAGEGPLSMLTSLALILPSIAVTVRRLHDVGRSGWWILAPFVPLLPVLMQSGSLLTGAQPEGGGLTLVVLVLFAGLVLSLILSLIVLIWTVTRSRPGTNRFGPSPLEQQP